MKKNIIIIAITAFVFSGCTNNLLEQLPPDQISGGMYWKTPDDAESAVAGVYAAMRDYFGSDYRFDSNVDVCHGVAYGNEEGDPSGLRDTWDGCYKIVNYANSTLQGIARMEAQTTDASQKKNYGVLAAEVHFLRAMAYFRLMDIFSAVPYMDRPLTQQEAIKLNRMPVGQLRDKIMDDLNDAVSVLPPTAKKYGHATCWAALSLRGKVNLFWASWLKNKRPEWSEVKEDPNTYFIAARDDFQKVMKESGHKLFRDGQPGNFNNPNYRQLFSLENEMCEEIIFSAQYTGPKMGLGSEMKAIFSPRQGGNNGALTPTIKLMDMYLMTDGTKASALVPNKVATTVNGTTNPNSYKGRDWRMKASILWDGEKLLMQNSDGTTFAKDSAQFLWGNKGSGSLDDPYYDYYNQKSGYAFRKWMPTYLGYERFDCPQDFYLIRYADVLLMYCEAVNEINNGPTDELQTIVNSIRRRGNIDALTTIAGMGHDQFFELLVNERAVEFIAEGQRYFDIRRWRIAEKVWNNGAGYTLVDTWGTKVQDEFVNAQAIQFERFYTGQIPTEEITMNGNLVQNDAWL